MINTNNIINLLFGDLNNQYCKYFFVLSVLGLITTIIFTVLLLLRMFKLIKNYNSFMLFQVVINSLLFYFANRLYYSMCMKSLS
jgi:hypothetical protein